MNKNIQHIEEMIQLGEEVQHLEEKNCPTNPSKWSYYKSQAKQKFDVYPSAYANGWASKQYKAAGGGWKQCAGESVNENKVDKLRNAVQKINRKYQVKVSTHPVTKGEIEIILGRGNHPDNVYHSIEKLVSKLGFKRGQYSIFDESVNEASVSDFEIGDFVHFKSKNKTGMVVSVKGNKVTINTPKGKITSDVKDVKVLHQDNVNEAYIVTYAKKKGEKPASAAFQLRGSALSFEKDLKKDGYITMVTQKKVKGIDESVTEDENDPQEIKVGNYQTKYFHVCPGASTLYKDIESKGVDMDIAERSVRLQDALFFIEEHIQRDGYDPEKDYVMVAKNIAKNIMKLAKMMGLEEEHNYIQGHIDTIEKVINGGSVNEGNAFTGALFKARKEGLTEFEFNGKKYPVHKLEEEEVIEEGVQSKHKLVKEGVMSNIDMLAGESDTFMDFMKTFKKEYPEFDYKNKDLVKWLQSTYKSKRG